MHYILLSASELYPMVKPAVPTDGDKWVSGERLVLPPEKMEFLIDGKGTFSWCDYFSQASNIPLFSPLMKECLEKCGVNNVDYNEAAVRHVPSGEVRKYYAANVIGLTEGVDRNQSKFTPFDESEVLIESFDKLVLDEKMLAGFGLCRLAEFDLLLVVDERIKKALMERKATWVICLEPEKWDGLAT